MLVINDFHSTTLSASGMHAIASTPRRQLRSISSFRSTCHESTANRLIDSNSLLHNVDDEIDVPCLSAKHDQELLFSAQISKYGLFLDGRHAVHFSCSCFVCQWLAIY